ncbi:disease resistance protein TAO1-like [Chenopodium quinoa]|uniref:disease resistance protein TAO1-like n=1 Tax=Chenopodium quinoa TaxID=63459 RepID=UPI000B778459|nr:disease resistance protein TAO1-like [Chenopodium quinoa]
MEGGSEYWSSSSSPSLNMIPKIKTPPYLPPSMLEKRVNWDVFLSFRGEDTRHNFTTFLRDALEIKGLRPFMDDKGMEKGDAIQPTLDEAIVDSALAVAIISPRYADSRWCLDELSRLFECRKRVIPVFYGVDPSDVRRQRGELGMGFQKLTTDDAKKFSEAEIQKWRSALEEAGKIAGYPCYSQSDETEDVIQRIVLQVWCELKNTPEYVVKFPVGLDSRVDKVIETLDLHSLGVRFLGIHGTPGIGKTTLAKAVFNKLVIKFKHRCYISNVREQLCTKEGVMGVQGKLISDLSLKTMLSVKEDDVVNRQKIKMIVNENRVLVVLDDVSEAGQLEKLGIVREWFEDGSRIIVTSRNLNALHDFARNDHELYEAEKLDPGESLELFSIHALGRMDPTQELRDVSERIVSLTGGLPLALEVFGSSLVKKTKKEWEDALMKLKTFRPSNLQQVLKFSYDGLDDQEKIVFLDLSCLLIQMNLKREDVVDILEGCGLRAELAIGSLVTKSLLKIKKDSYKELWMHDQIRDMGRQIVIEESFQDTGKRSRLWDYEDIMHVLRHENVTDAVQGIALDIEKPPLDSPDAKSYWNNFKRNPNISTFIRYVKEKFKGLLSQHVPDEDLKPALQTIWFKKMVHLKLLQINYANLQGNFKYMSSELRWLQWKGCPQKTFPATMPEQIRVLDLSESRIEYLWYSDQVVGNLVVINLYGCPCLTALPDMSGHRHLKKLTLELCMGLTKIHKSIGNMSSLVHLNLRRCSNLVDFPRDVTGMKGLRELLLSECRKFTGLPHDVRSMTSLIQLHLDKTAISELPEYLFHLTQLEELSLQSCYQLTRLPEEIGSLISLKKLSLSRTNLKELPVLIGSMASLEELSLVSCSLLTALPESVGRLKSLTALHLNSTSIQELPSSICALSCLKVLSLESCHSLVKLPDSVAGLASIVDLKLTNTPIKSLPDDICCLKFIEKLQMTGCSFLEKLPESIGKMSNLTMLTVAGANLTHLPESIGELENLTWLNLNNCQNLCSLPESIGSLGSLCIFMMEETAVTCFPESFGLLGDLRVLKMKKSSNKLARLSGLPVSFCKLSNLEEFDARTCGICGQIGNDFNKLSKLEILNLGYNDFHSLPVTLEGLSVLQKLLLRHCTKLRSLPQLPSTLVELNAADCYELMSISDLSNLERLQELQLVNCNKVIDVPGLECLKSLRRLFMGGCNKAIKSAVQRRLRKATLRNLNNLSVPGSEIPNWFTQTTVTFAAHPNLGIKNVIVALVVSVDRGVLDEIRVHQYPGITDIQACIFRLGEPIFRTTLYLMGVPRTQEDQLYLCRFKAYNPLVSLLQEGDIIRGSWRRGTVTGIEMKRWGIHLVFENDDDFDGDEDSLSVVESHQSVSQRLLNFFRSMDQ